MALDPSAFYDEALKANNVEVAFGVPDSVLSGLASYLSATKPPHEHIVMASEGGGVAMGAGYHLNTGKIALVYMQNSGLSNALNPLQSLAAKEVFGIPMLVMVGWRGMPGVKDEPQHALTGPRLLDIVNAHDLPYKVLPQNLPEACSTIAELVATAYRQQTPVVVIIPPKTFGPFSNKESPRLPAAISTPSTLQDRSLDHNAPPSLSREGAVRCVLNHVQKNEIVVCALGGATRELYMIRQEEGKPMGANFMCVGAMGHTFALAHGIAMGDLSRKVICIDGDGSFLMHVGNNAILSMKSPRNVVHVVLYNGTYGSTGDQPLTLTKDQFVTMAAALPYKEKILVDRAETLATALESATAGTIIIVSLNTSVRDTLPRPPGTPQDWKEDFKKSL